MVASNSFCLPLVRLRYPLKIDIGVNKGDISRSGDGSGALAQFAAGGIHGQ
jgi:hypothetical protein